MVGTDCNSAWGTQSQINLLMRSRSPGPTVKETPIFHHLGSHEGGTASGPIASLQDLGSEAETKFQATK